MLSIHLCEHLACYRCHVVIDAKRSMTLCQPTKCGVGQSLPAQTAYGTSMALVEWMDVPHVTAVAQPFTPQRLYHPRREAWCLGLEEEISTAVLLKTVIIEWSPMFLVPNAFTHIADRRTGSHVWFTPAPLTSAADPLSTPV